MHKVLKRGLIYYFQRPCWWSPQAPVCSHSETGLAPRVGCSCRGPGQASGFKDFGSLSGL